MVERTFKPFFGIGPIIEKRLHAKGIYTWEDLLSYKGALPINNLQNYNDLFSEIKTFIEAKAKGDLNFLIDRFPQEEKWRILADYFSRASYFDIETTGLSLTKSEITVIVCFHRGKLHTFVQGENLNDFFPLLDEIELLVSFNGTVFDIPMIESKFRLSLAKYPQVDLRWISYYSGFQGGLKEIEKQLSIFRPRDLLGMDGYQAVLLWKEWQETSNLKAKKKLIRYCQADVLSLILLAGALLEKKNVPIRSPGVKIFEQITN